MDVLNNNLLVRFEPLIRFDFWSSCVSLVTYGPYDMGQVGCRSGHICVGSRVGLDRNLAISLVIAKMSFVTKLSF